MRIEKNLKKTLSFDPDRCNNLYTELLETFQKHRPLVGEIIVAMGNLFYALGASIEGYQEKGPSFEELKKIYYMYPKKIGLAMMMQGFMVMTWFEDYQKIKIEETENKNKEETKE
jgi:hypothetical protein